MKFELYVETGPRHRKTMVHVGGLLGCTAMGATTDEAIEKTRAALSQRLAFLRRHGEDVPDPEPIEFEVAEEDLSGDFLGFAVTFFEADRAPLTEAELRRTVRWLGWSREALVDAARAQPGGIVSAPARGRTALAILQHVAGSERGYLNSVVGPVPGLNAAVKALENATGEPWDPLGEERALVVDRMLAMDDAERSTVVQRGKQPQSARRMARKMLEHEWEHVLELQARLQG